MKMKAKVTQVELKRERRTPCSEVIVVSKEVEQAKPLKRCLMVRFLVQFMYVRVMPF